MRHDDVQLKKVWGGWRRPLLGVFFMLGLAACGRQQDFPVPPSAPPKPVTDAGHIITAQFDLQRAMHPAPGQM